MTPKDDVYTAITPLGPVEVEFPEDGGSLFAGTPQAVQYLTDTMARNTNAMGIGMTQSNLEPFDLVCFCQPAGSGIVIIEPFNDLLQYGPLRDEPAAD